MEGLKLPLGLFLNTSAYFLTMAAGLLFWCQFAVVYLEEDTAFRQEAPLVVCPEDLDHLQESISRENILQSLARNGTFTLTYRIMADGVPVYMNMKISPMEDDKDYIIIGVTNIDNQMQTFLSHQQQKRQSDAMITALSADYHSVFYINLDSDEAICYRMNQMARMGLQSGESFPFRQTLEDYAHLSKPLDIELLKKTLGRMLH